MLRLFIVTALLLVVWMAGDGGSSGFSKFVLDCVCFRLELLSCLVGHSARDVICLKHAQMDHELIPIAIANFSEFTNPCMNLMPDAFCFYSHLAQFTFDAHHSQAVRTHSA